MSTEQYCEPCKRLLRGEIEPIEETRVYIKFTHHPDAGSFKKALELPCSICSFTWYATKCPSSWLESASKGTTAHMYGSFYDGDARTIHFSYGPNGKSSSVILRFVPWESVLPEEL
jgi:hypothetical protein